MKVPDAQYSRPQEITPRGSHAAAQTAFSEQLARTHAGAPATPADAPEDANTSSVENPRAVISAEERDYFANLFPTAPGELNTSQTYGPAGACHPGGSGSLLDRKG